MICLRYNRGYCRTLNYIQNTFHAEKLVVWLKKCIFADERKTGVAMELPEVLYPLGNQSFEKIISAGKLYVDKTALIYRMTHTYDYVFLSRPAGSVSRCFAPRKQLISVARRNCSVVWQWSSWRKTGLSIL